MPEHRPSAIAFGPIGLAGWGLLVLGVLTRRRLAALIGLTAVVADVTVSELGGFKARDEGTAEPPDESTPPWQASRSS